MPIDYMKVRLAQDMQKTTPPVEDEVEKTDTPTEEVAGFWPSNDGIIAQSDQLSTDEWLAWLASRKTD